VPTASFKSTNQPAHFVSPPLKVTQYTRTQHLRRLSSVLFTAHSLVMREKEMDGNSWT
jgi:hypothetical protein